MNEDRASRQRTELEIFTACVAAMDRREDVLACISESDTVEDAESAVVDLLHVTREGAAAIMNLQFRRLTRTDRARFVAARNELRQALDGLSGE